MAKGKKKADISFDYANHPAYDKDRAFIAGHHTARHPKRKWQPALRYHRPVLVEATDESPEVLGAEIKFSLNHRNRHERREQEAEARRVRRGRARRMRRMRHEHRSLH